MHHGLEPAVRWPGQSYLSRREGAQHIARVFRFLFKMHQLAIEKREIVSKLFDLFAARVEFRFRVGDQQTLNGRFRDGWSGKL